MLRKHIERIVRFPVTTILLAVLITVFFAFQISGLHMVLDPKALLPQDHPYVKLNNEIEKQFGGSRIVLIGLASKDGDIFNPSDIEKIRKINEEVKTLPGILENNVVSIADRKVKVVKAEGDSLEINSLLDGIEYTPEGMKKLKDRVYSNPAFINSLISEDGTVAAIILDFRGGESDWLKKQSKAADSSEQKEVHVIPSEAGIHNEGIVLDSHFRGNDGQQGITSLLTSSAWAQEDWKKWQQPEQKPEPSPLAGEGKGGGAKDTESSAPAETTPVDGQQDKTSAQNQEGKWPASGESGWQAGKGEADWEQFYVSDSKIHSKVLDIVNKYKDANTEIYVGGLPIALSFLEADSWRMSRYIYPVAVIIIMFILYLAFRSIQGMILPIICALLSVVWAVGLMGVFKIPLDPWNMMTPILILAVAAGHSVQILKRYYEELEKSPSPYPSPLWGEGIGQLDDPEVPHIISPSPRWGEGMGEGGASHWGADASRQAVITSLTKIGPVMITAGIVAAASFASLLTFQLRTFQSFGLFTAFGILSALVLEMTFIPAARSLMRPPRKSAGDTPTPTLPRQGGGSAASIPSPLAGEGQGGGAGSILDRFLLAIAGLVTQRTWLVWVGLVVVIAISLYGINRLTVINSLKSLFFESTQFRKDDAALNKYFGGTATFYVYLEGQGPDALKNPAVLHAIENLQKEIEAVPEVGKTQSYVDYVKATNQSMHGGDPAYRTIPDSQATISEYLFLFSLSGSDGEMNRFLDYQYQKSVIWVFLRDDSTVLGEKLIAIVNKYNPSPIPSPQRGEGMGEGGALGFPPGIKIGVAGSIPVMMALNQTMVSGKIWNILQIAGIVFVITSIVLRSPVGGILVLLPLGIAVLINFGVLGLAGIGLGVGTAAISAMSVGFGADYSIYLLYRLREEVRGEKTEVRSQKLEVRSEKIKGGGEKREVDAAVRRTLLTAGKAIIFVALALSAGGFTLLFTGYYLHMEGFLVPLAMITSSLATLIVLPAIVKVVKPGFIFR